jgi:hypothetical protein
MGSLAGGISGAGDQRWFIRPAKGSCQEKYWYSFRVSPTTKGSNPTPGTGKWDLYRYAETAGQAANLII